MNLNPRPTGQSMLKVAPNNTNLTASDEFKTQSRELMEVQD